MIRHVSRGEVLFREGEPGVGLWVCHRGRVRLSRRTADGRERVLKIIRPGETFAEVVLFETRAYPATATALEDGVLFVVPAAALRARLREEEFRDDFLAMVMRKLRHLADQLSGRAGADLAERFEAFLDEQFGAARRIETQLTRRDVAAALGVAPETLSRLLRSLRTEGRLRWRGRVIERLPRP
ncbi:MAG: Crp/Fnr family transcriptional regulator [Kiritimatiellae bacterium]|nr:Crp/Fnr family transcriptional regulator [Kiritimatiellia bacterium]